MIPAFARIRALRLFVVLIEAIDSNYAPASLRCPLLDEKAAPKPIATPVSPAANTNPAVHSPPAYLLREAYTHRAEITAAHHDAAGQPCSCAECGGCLRGIGRDVSEQLEFCSALTINLQGARVHRGGVSELPLA